MNLAPKAGIGEAGTGLEGIRESIVVRREASFKEVHEKESSGVEEGVVSVGLEHGVAKDEVRVRKGGKEAGGIVDGARGGG